MKHLSEEQESLVQRADVTCWAGDNQAVTQATCISGYWFAFLQKPELCCCSFLIVSTFLGQLISNIIAVCFMLITSNNTAQLWSWAHLLFFFCSLTPLPLEQRQFLKQATKCFFSSTCLQSQTCRYPPGRLFPSAEDIPSRGSGGHLFCLVWVRW